MKTIKHISGSLFFVLLLSFAANAQDLDVVLTPSSFAGGYGVSCNNSQNGSIICVPVGGVSPYTFLWSNSSTTQDLYDLAAGTYSVTVTDSAGSTITAYAELLQADPLTITVTSSDYNGYGVSSYGGNDGWLSAAAAGGTPSYAFEWSTTDEGTDIGDLGIGDYSVTVYDMNGCSATSSTITLTQPTELKIDSVAHSDYHGYGVSCNKGSDGTARVYFSGGVPGYGIDWSNGAFDTVATDLHAGKYVVHITDANGAEAIAAVVLTQPDYLEVKIVPSIYNINGKEYNISCNNCFNGSASLDLSGGVTPFTYTWYKGMQTTASIAGLGAGGYEVVVMDANGCKQKGGGIQLWQPERNDWTMNGNANIDTAQFIGTTDSNDVVLKSNSVERMRIGVDGTVDVKGVLKIAPADTDSIRAVYVNESGRLMVAYPNPASILPCPMPTSNWYTDYCNGNQDNIFNNPLTGRVGIGITTIPSNYKLVVEGQIGAREVVVVKPGDPWPDYVFKKSYKQLSLGELSNFIKENEHLPNMPDATEIETNGQPIGKIQLLQQEKIEELYLYVMELDKKMESLKNENEVLKSQIKKIASKK